MSKVTFEECISFIHKGSVIKFREYVFDRHEKKRLTLSIDNGVVQEVFPANVRLSRETLEMYYGTELSELDYLQLSLMNCPRIVVGLGFSKEENKLNIKIIVLNKDFYQTGLQTLEITNELNVSDEPIYLQSQMLW